MSNEQREFQRALASAAPATFIPQKTADMSAVAKALQEAVKALFERVNQPDYVLTAFDFNLLAFTGRGPSSLTAVKAMAQEHGGQFAALAKYVAAHLQRQIKPPKRPQTLKQLGKALENQVRVEALKNEGYSDAQIQTIDNTGGFLAGLIRTNLDHISEDEISSGTDDPEPEPQPATYHAPGKDPINDDPEALASLGAWVAKAIKR